MKTDKRPPKTCAVVISNIEQWEAFRNCFSDISSFKIYCDNPRFYHHLVSKHVNFIKLHEYLISEDLRREMNLWGHEVAASWIRYTKDRGYFKSCDLPAIMFLALGHHLIQLLKNRFYAKFILNQCGEDKIIIFDTMNTPVYPRLSGNIWLNKFLKRYADTSRILSVSVRYQSRHQLQGLLSQRQHLLSAVREKARKLFTRIYSYCVVPNNNIEIIVHGSLRHTSHVINALRKKAVRMAYYDESFQIKHFIFSIRNIMPYVVADCFSKKKYISEKQFVEAVLSDLRASAASAIEDRLFLFQRENLGDFIDENIFQLMQAYVGNAAEYANHAENIIKQTHLKKLIQDQDTNGASAILATYLSNRGVKTYTVSHALLPVDFNVSQYNQVFGVSKTFVNSQYERDMYVARGWNRNRIVVTGLPRFDEYIAHKKRSSRRSDQCLRILYCGASMKKYGPDRGGYLGYHVTNTGVVQQPSLKLILETLEKYSEKNRIEVVFKPHNYEGDAWPRFIREIHPKFSYRIAKYNEKFSKLLDGADLMILAHWSTAMIEAGLIRKPTIMVDMFQSQNIAPYEKYGLCRVVRDEAGLTGALRDYKALTGNRDASYCLGYGDLQSTARLIQGVLQQSV